MIRLSTRSSTYANMKTLMRQTSLMPNIIKHDVHRNLTSSATNPDNLPHYPVPKLEDTLKKFLRSVQPLLTTESYSRTEKLVKDFSKSNGTGQQLHSLLKAKSEKTENWLADWWISCAYLAYRLSVVVNSNPGLYFPTKFFENDYQWLTHATKVIWAALKYKEMIDLNQIAADKMGTKLLDMSQYRKIFGTCRIPAPDCDKIEYHPNSKHIVVAYRNVFFKVPVYTKGSQKILSEDEIMKQLLEIVRPDVKADCPVGILTSEHRDTLAPAYANLVKDPQNRASVDTITKSLFLVCLDKRVPCDSDFKTASHQLIHGGGSTQNSGNRWFDKTVQFVINENGLNGLNYEHSPAEGQPIAILTDFITAHLKKESPVTTEYKQEEYEKPSQLKFNINQQIEKDVASAKKHIDELAGNLHMNIVYYKGYGKNFIKSQKMSPDSFVQMAMQYAFYKYHGEPGAHYETAQQRLFIHGRTETIRSCSVESLAFAKGMCNPSTSDAEKVNLLKAAVLGHKNYTTMAMTGEGIDRHLLGMKLIARENDISLPEFYNDDGYVKSTHFRISTSQVASNNKLFMCYGPVVEDGYGICYNPRNDDMILAVSSFRSCAHTSADTMADHLKQALDDMYAVLLRAGEKPKSKI